MRKFVLGLALLAGGLTATAAKAETNYLFDFGLGYSRVNIDGANAKELDGDENLSGRFKMMFLPERRSPWRIGFSIAGASAFQDVDPFTLDGHVYTDHPFKEFEMLVPEFRVAYNLPIGKNFFVEPSIGIGPAFGHFRAGEDFGDWGEGDDRVTVNVALEPTLQIGYGQDRWAAGAELSYMVTRLDFGDQIGGDIEVLYLGAFFRLEF